MGRVGGCLGNSGIEWELWDGIGDRIGDLAGHWTGHRVLKRNSPLLGGAGPGWASIEGGWGLVCTAFL